MLRSAGPVAFALLTHLSYLCPASDAGPPTAGRPLPTEREAQVLAALNEPTAIDFADKPLNEVIDFLEQQHEINIQLDVKALTDAGVGTDAPITRTLEGVTLRSLLRLVLGELDLAYVVGDGFLLITSRTEAESLLRFRVYPVEDLVTTDSDFRPPLGPGVRPEPDFQSLIDMITSCVAPTTWDEVGGPGSIRGHRNSLAMTVTQTDEVHEELVALLECLRHVRDKQLAVLKPLDLLTGKEAADRYEGAIDIRVHHLMIAPQPTMAPGPGGQPAPVKAAEQKEAPPPSAEEIAAAQDRLQRKLEFWAQAVARLAPEMIEPETWEPAGPGRIRAVGNTVVVRQNDEVQYRVARLINELLPGNAPQCGPAYHPAIRLRMPAIKTNWPAEAEPLAGETETRIRTALESPCHLDLAERPLQAVIGLLAKLHDIRIQVDQKALADAGVGSDTPVTRTLHAVTLKTALELIFGELDLTYVIRDEVLLITSKSEAENMLCTKVYPVFDLVVRPRDASPRVPGLDFPSLIENITDNLAPTTWDEVGGPGSVVGFANAGALVVSQTTAVHEQLTAYLKALREVARDQNAGLAVKAAAHAG